MTVSASAQDATCYKDNDGYIDLSSTKISGGTTPYSISFTQGSTTTDHSPQKFENLAAATYYYTVEDANGCTVDDEATVGQPDSLALTIDVEDISCKNAEDGSIQLESTGGNDSFTYYQKATGAADYSSNSSGTFSDLLPTSYEVKVIDNKGCETIDNLVLTEPDSILIEDITITDIECSNTVLGSIALDVSGGNELIYSWDEYPDSSRSELTGIRGGTYTFEVTDNKHCPSFGTKSAFVFESEPITVSTSQEDLTCFKSQDGSISLTVSDGGTAPYTYSLIGQSENQSTGDFDDLAATTFDWKVSDAEGCFQSGEITLTQPDTMVLALSSIDTVSCKDYINGAFEVSATGGTGSYFYSLDGAAYQEEKNSYSLLSAGSYTVALKDERGCTATPLDVVLTEPDSLKIEEIVSTDILCHGEATGAITVSTTGGNSEHSFQWIGYPDHSDATFEQLPAGNYAFNVTDRKYCPSYGSKTIVLSQPSALTLTATSVDVSCHNAQNGEISLQAQGGVAPYQYRINQEGYGTAQAFASLDTGAYTWTVKDDNLCELSSTEDILITQPDSLRLAVSQFDSISCYGAKDGALELSASGGTSPYAYAFDTYSYSEGATTYQDIDTGQYTIRLQDDQGCKDSIALDYVQADSLVIDSIAVIDLICAEESNGSMLAYVSGGNGGTTYHWTEFTENNQANIDNIAGGTYSLYVSDRRACETPLMSAVVFEPAKMEVSTTPEDATCNGEINGSIVLNITAGGTAPFEYSIDNGQSFSDDPLFSSQAFGLYQWVVKDSNACQVSGEVEINEPTPLVFDLKETKPTLCFASSDGSVSLSASGGTRPYGFSIDKESYDTDSTLGNLPAGDYKVYIKDRYNCIDSLSVSITEPTAITATFDNTHLICTGDTNGTSQVSLSGGTPNYSLLWNDGQTSTLAENLSADTYQLTVTDANECEFSFETAITQPTDSFKVSIDHVVNAYCYQLSNGTLEASLAGGTAPYSYAWNDPDNTTDALQLNNLAHSSYYRITATDQLGCQKEDSAYIDFDIPFEVLDIPSDTLVLCDNESMTLDQTQSLVSNYLWLHNGATFSTDPVVTIDTTGEFSITIADALGCMDSRTFYVDTSENNVKALFIASNKVVYGDTLRFIDVSWPNPQTLVWDFGDGYIVEDDEVSPVIGFPDDIDSTEVKITATLGTCVDHYSKMIYFYPEDQLGQSTSKLGFKGIIEYNIQPNPTAGEFYLRVKLHEQAPVLLKIFDVSGELVEQKEVSGQAIYREQFDLNNVPRGVYFLRMESNEDFQIVRFLVY